MAVSSPLNPSTIVKERSGRTSSSSAQNFITGGSPLGSGVVSSAANKIVGFSRGGAAGVAAKPPDLQGIISTLSSSILNNVENRVTSINNNVTQVVQGKLQELESEHKSRLAQIESARPNAILNNFLTLYKEAIGYIQFLGDRNNVKTLGDNLKGLQNVFAEAFNVARIIRETIKRTVGQLSSLPKASTGGGGLSLDIGIPGPGLRMGSMGKLARAVKKGRLPLMLGGAALAGGLGSKVVSGMMDIGEDNVQGVGMAEGSIPGALLDRFSGILDRFDAAIKALTQGGKQSVSSSTGASVSMDTEQQETPSADPGGATPSSGAAGLSDTTVSGEVDASGLKSNFAPIAQDIINSGHIDTTSLRDRAALGAMMAVGQMETNFAYKDAYTGRGGTGNNMQGFIQLNRGVHPQSAFVSKKAYLDYVIPKFKGTSSTFTGAKAFNPLIFAEKLRSAKTGWDVSLALQAGGFNVNDFDPLDTPEEANRLTRDQVEAIKKLVFDSMNLKPTATPTATATPAKPGVAAAPGQAVNNKNVAQTVAQPPPAPQTTVTVAPVNVASPQTQSGGGQQKTIPPTQKMTGGGSVPFLRSSNDDNFLTIYSKMVYNVVDG